MRRKRTVAAMSNQHTPGPWRWQYNATSKSVLLVGGDPQFDKTVMQFERWGMSGAVPAFNSKITGCVWNLMERLCDKPDWIAPFPGREHHADWCSDVTHPDARLIAAAPEVIEMLMLVTAVFSSLEPMMDDTQKLWMQKSDALVAKVFGRNHD